jgi:ATP phosphoribosyltransferase
LFTSAGFSVGGYETNARDYRPAFDKDWLIAKVFRPQEIPLVVAEGYYDLGITGLDWLHETRCEKSVEDILDLGFGRVDVVLAVPNKWNQVKTAKDLFQLPKTPIRIWTEYINLASEYILDKTGIDPNVRSPWEKVDRKGWSNIWVFMSFGVTEAKPPEDAEAIIDNTSTGITLHSNGLKIVDKILKNSTARLIANRLSMQDPEKMEKINFLADGLRRVVPEKPTRDIVRTFGHI